jgi:hypothetical protein
MEAINEKVIQLEKQLEQRVAQESAISLLNTELQAGETLKEAYDKLVTISKQFLEQECERFQNVYVDLTQRDQLNRDELQETRQDVIKVNNVLFFVYIFNSICISNAMYKKFPLRMITMLSAWRA